MPSKKSSTNSTTWNINPRYEFGYGLSYTIFTYGKVEIKKTNFSALSSRYPTGALSLGGYEDLWHEVIQVTTTVRNMGTLSSAEVAQLYVIFPDEAAQPVSVLRGFEKVRIEAGASSSVTFSVRRRDISYWDTVAQNWAIAPYVFSVGASSRDIRGTVMANI